MASLFGEESVDDLLNDQLLEKDELPAGDEDEENDFGGNEAAAENGIKVEPKKRTVRNPRPRLTVETLRGPRGIQTIEEYFKDIRFHGKGNEVKDLDEVMRRLQHWAHRMYPNYTFDDVLNNIERLGRKKPLQVHMSRYRLDLLEQHALTEEALQNDKDEDMFGNNDANDEPFDEFDALLGEQIAISRLAPHTPAIKKVIDHTITTPSFTTGNNAVPSTPVNHTLNNSELAVPLPPTPKPQLTAERLERIAENKRRALEKLQAKKAQNNIQT